ncbi:MAG: hypothetical protein V9E94_18615 [Microthrixaceae bacterium]
MKVTTGARTARSWDHRSGGRGDDAGRVTGRPGVDRRGLGNAAARRGVHVGYLSGAVAGVAVEHPAVGPAGSADPRSALVVVTAHLDRRGAARRVAQRRRARADRHARREAQRFGSRVDQ